MRNRQKKGSLIMNIIEFMKNLDAKILCAIIALISSIIGTILGAFLTFIFNILNEIIKRNRDHIVHIRDVKENIYQKCCELLDKVTLLDKNNVINNTEYYERMVDNFISISVQMKLFAPRHIFEKFLELVKEFSDNKDISNEKEKDFINILRKDLKIEE